MSTLRRQGMAAGLGLGLLAGAVFLSTPTFAARAADFTAHASRHSPMRPKHPVHPKHRVHVKHPLHPKHSVHPKHHRVPPPSPAPVPPMLQIPVLRLPAPAKPPANPPTRLPASPPTQIRIPAIRVNAPVIRVGLTNTGALNVPPVTNANLAGWYEYGPAPGQPGATVIVGHYDTYVGPAVFYRLSKLHRGEKIWIRLADRRTVVFAVRSAQAYPKNDFPTGKVYVNGGPPTLRLITCAGAFDWATRHYLDDRVVYATYVRSFGPPHPVKRSHRRQHPRIPAIRQRPKNRKLLDDA